MKNIKTEIKKKFVIELTEDEAECVRDALVALEEQHHQNMYEDSEEDGGPGDYWSCNEDYANTIMDLQDSFTKLVPYSDEVKNS